ncbi:MAG: chemotaxis protein [Deltaproteobacteria bacterium]|jgi:two-component system chemotaxis response regulator CheV|nr:chemotaxis protein [Deltaproteobacteria bacterium]
MEHQGASAVLDGNELEIIEFYLDEAMPDGSSYRGYFGMNVAKVLEIIRKPPVTGVPGKHHQAALGTFNLRGRVLPLVDLGLWLGKRTTGSANDKVIVSEFSSVVTAFIVSGVTRIHRMTWGQVEPPGKYLQAFSHDCITGVIRFEERIVFLLDMEQVISSMDPSLNLSAHLSQIASTDGSGLHILVADDSPSIRNTISRCLEQARFSVTKTTCGREAWEQLKAWEQQAAKDDAPLTNFVNLVVSDIEMPEMDGHTLTRKIKDDAVLKQLPVILFSSLISNVVREKGRAAGADDQISKPDLPRLTERAHALIRKSLAEG